MGHHHSSNDDRSNSMNLKSCETMNQKQMTNYIPHRKKPKQKLDTWTIKYVYEGQRSVWTPDYVPENPLLEDCTEVVIVNQRTGEAVTFSDETGLKKFWEECKEFSFEWKGGERIQRKTVREKIRKSGYFKITEINET